MELSRSFRLGRCSSLRLGRSYGSLLRSESVAESATITGYERLSESMRMSNEPDFSHGRKKSRAYGFLSKVLNIRKFAGDFETNKQRPVVVAEVEKKKKRSSWLPDPARRWPVQGW